ncbi:MAG: DUF116 domain-containing protein [bacterium]|nr:DUF116 domain-containing protein [bacterium]
MGEEETNKEKDEKSSPFKDRVLGDEWLNWDGDFSSTDAVISANKRLFLGFSFFVLILFNVLIALILFLIAPRLAEFHKAIPEILYLSLMIISGFIWLWFIMIGLSILTMKNFFFFSRHVPGKKFKLLHILLPQVIKFGKLFRVSEDKLRHSFIKVNNSLIEIVNFKPHKPILILLPRCLKPEIMKELREYGKEIGCPVFTATGGSIARKVIKDIKPSAIIAIACERDLVAGLQDIGLFIPVLAFSNERPEGPCKNTRVDLEKIKAAIRLFSEGKVKKEAYIDDI